MSRNRMSEKEKVYFFCILFPVLWIFLPALIACDIAEAIKAWWQRRT
ncbi:hypothetical protein [Bradyrhizobium sp. LVM 105]|nr:hypothetical protein [Bradyrhizobium sp. LVM 105]